MEEPTPTNGRDPRLTALAKGAALVAAGALAGGLVVYLTQHHSTGSAAAANTPAGLRGGFPGPRGGFGGGVAGEQRLSGTLTATRGSTITVKTSSGTTATYTVNATTQIIRNGRSASLSDLQAGDPVLLRVYPSATGQMLVERMFAGTLPGGGAGQRPGLRFN